MKKAPPTINQLVSRSDADRALGEFRSLSIERGRIHLQIEAERKAIEDRYQERLTAIDAKLQGLAAGLSDWADLHPSEFANRKSLELTHGVIGWRTGNPTLKTRKGFTWDRVLERILAMNLGDLVRHKKEVAKDAILLRRQELEKSGQLEQMGLRVVQEEPFFVDPKIDEPALPAIEA